MKTATSARTGIAVLDPVYILVVKSTSMRSGFDQYRYWMNGTQSNTGIG